MLERVSIPSHRALNKFDIIMGFHSARSFELLDA
jgi:hypothetical protein